MNRQLLFDNLFSVQLRFCYMVLEQMNYEMDVDRIAEIMNCQKKTVYALLEEMERRKVIAQIKWDRKKKYAEIIPVYKDPQEIINQSPLFRKPIPPNNFQEVHEYFYQQKKTANEAIEFFNYYEAVGWYSGNQPITNWRAKALSWSKDKFKLPIPDPQQNNNGQQPTTKKQEDFWKRNWE